MSARDEELAAVVAEQGALPVPAGSVPQPVDLVDQREQAEAWEGHIIGAWDGEFAMESGLDRAVLKLARMVKADVTELERLRARVEELEAERHTTNEALSDAAEALRADRDRIAQLEAECNQLRQLPGLPIDKLAKALLLMESGPALPWAQAMSDDDLHGFLGDLVSAAMNRWRHSPEVPDRVTLAEIEKACAQWRTPGHGLRSDEPGPDGITRVIAATQALQEPVEDVTPQVQKLRSLLAGQREAVDGEHYPAVHHSYRVGRDLPEVGGAQ